MLFQSSTIASISTIRHLLIKFINPVKDINLELFPSNTKLSTSLLFVSTCCFLHSNSALGFEAYEHKKIANAAIHVAFEYFENTKKFQSLLAKGSDYTKVLDKWKQARSELLSSGCNVSLDDGKLDIDYGMISKGVDDMRYPRFIFDRIGPHDNYELKLYPEEEAGLNRIAVENFWEEFSLDLFSSSNRNHQHFQGELFQVMLELHNDAIHTAHKGNIFSGLVLNALSDHFLHDFFAPGHITTTRENSHDGAALSLHDWQNSNGSYFKINQENWGQLEEILIFIKDNHSRFNLFFDKEDIHETPGCKTIGTITQKEYAIENNQRQKETILQLLNEHDEFPIYGDNLLPGKYQQQLIMIIIEVRSILDVMDAYLSAYDPANHHQSMPLINNFDTYTWSGTYDDAHESLKIPDAGIKYGRYKIEEKNIGRAHNIVIHTFAGHAPRKDFEASGEYSLEVVPLEFLSRFDSIRNSVMQRPSSNCKYFSLCNLAPSLGYVHEVHSKDSVANGIQLRLIKVTPKIGLLQSAYVRRMKHDRKGLKKYTNAAGIRLDVSFSIVSTFVGLEYGSNFLETSNDFETGFNFTFGIGFGLPTSRHWGLN